MKFMTVCNCNCWDNNIIEYKGNPWKMELPEMKKLEKAIDLIIKDYSNYSKKARLNAIENFDINIIEEKYIFILKKLY